MTSTLKAFMEGLVDYAGLFPPARLDMSDAAATFARHLSGDYRWMLGCFVCPVSRLDALRAQRSLLERHAPILVSVLGTGPVGPDDFLDLATLDAELVSHFEADGWAQCSQLEIRWPHSLIDSGALRRYSMRLSSANCSYERLFFEIERRDTWDEDVVRMSAELARAGDSFGFKIRTGGLTHDLYPTPDQVAVAVAACRDAGVPIKATAGLHHPIRDEQEAGSVIQHGFINFFGAAVLAHAAGLDRSDLAAVIDARQLSDFDFGSDVFSWRGHSIGTEALREARSRLAFSFGSCSFDEPLEDLAAARLL